MAPLQGLPFISSLSSTCLYFVDSRIKCQGQRLWGNDQYNHLSFSFSKSGFLRLDCQQWNVLGREGQKFIFWSLLSTINLRELLTLLFLFLLKAFHAWVGMEGITWSVQGISKYATVRRPESKYTSLETWPLILVEIKCYVQLEVQLY